MDPAQARRQRIAQLVDLAQNYRQWTRRELADALNRDPTKIIPGSGVPKLDLVVDLAQALEWEVEDVVAYIWGRDDELPRQSILVSHADFASADQAAREAHRLGQYHQMIELARRSWGLAQTAEERARACNREAGGWDGLGRFQNSLKAIQQGLAQRPVPGEFRRILQSNLANAYYSLWSLMEARAVAADLLAWFREHPAQSPRDRKSLAFSHYVAGHTARRLCSVEPDRAKKLAAQALVDLNESKLAYQALSRELGDDSLAGIANTCVGGIIEAEAAIGARDPKSALALIADGIDQLGEECDRLSGDHLESYGWWCIFGCNIALRHLSDERDVQRHMAMFTMKADQIAERLDSWTIRERVFTMEHMRWERAVGCTGFDIPSLVDEEDVRVITGTMARFPSFRETGWQILRSARLVAVG